MRLASCVAVELGVLALTGATIASGALWATGHLPLGEAQAAARVARPRLHVPRAPEAIGIAYEPALRWHGPLATGSFVGVPDEELLAPLRTGQLTRVKTNRGGTSISLRLDFDNGARAAFKPRQTNLQTIPRKEVAAYRISRLLGLSAVQPAIGRSFPKKDLLDKLAPESRWAADRLQAEIVHDDGIVIGEMSWWIPVIRRAKFDGFPIDSVEGIVAWKRLLLAGAKVPAKDRDMLRQISNLLVFDFVINNRDRWSGGNAKVSEDGKILYFMDNTLSFSPHPRAERKVRLYLQRTQMFSKQLIDALRGLDEDFVRRALAEDIEPFDHLLDDEEIKAMFSRRKIALDYVDRLVAEHGEDKVLTFK